MADRLIRDKQKEVIELEEKYKTKLQESHVHVRIGYNVHLQYLSLLS